MVRKARLCAGRKGVVVKVLVADDDSVMRKLLERQLSEWGHEVCTARDGTEALQHIENQPELDVLLLDWMMPGPDGLEVCRLARQLERSHYVFIVLITSRSGKEDYLAGMSAGADDFVTKPVDTDELRVRMYSAERVIRLKTEAQVQAAIAAELRELDAMKSAFISLTSHELRSPLAIIMMDLDFLTMQEALQRDDLQEVVGLASKAAERLCRIVEETLKASKDGNYSKGLNLEPVDVHALVRETVDEVMPFAALRSQQIRMQIEPDLPGIMMDAPKIRDALANLLMNAVKFTPDGKVIDVKVVREYSGAVVFSVTDPGIGICDADKPHIFEHLFSTLNIMHHSSGFYEFGKRGIGLGLAIVKNFVELHGGSVGFESTEGQGSCFHFTVPVIS